MVAQYSYNMRYIAAQYSLIVEASTCNMNKKERRIPIMVRINLSIDDDLFTMLSQDATRNNCTVNVYLISLLEKVYKQNPFDYAAALATLEKEAMAQPVGQEFTLVNLPSFGKISVTEAKNANLRPSVVRARLGKMFNFRVKTGMVGTVARAINSKGKLKFQSRAAVYVNR